MLKRNDFLVARMLEDKEAFVLGGVFKPIWINGEPTSDQAIEVHCVVLLEDLGFQYYRFKYKNTENNVNCISKLKTKGLIKLKNIPGYDTSKLFNYRDTYFGQNMIELGDVQI